MSVTIFGEYFYPMSIGLEILYYACIVTAAVLVCRNLYLAVRASMTPEEPQSGPPAAVRSAGTYSAREGQRPQRRDPVFGLFPLVILCPAFFPKSVEHRQNRRTMCAPTRCRVLPHHPGQRIRRAGVVAPYGVRRFAGRVR